MGDRAQAVIDRVVEKQFSIPANAAAALDVETFYGALKLTTASDAVIHVIVRESIEADNEAQADRQLRDLELQISDVASPTLEKVTVRSSFRRKVRWSWEKWPPLGLAFEIQIPSRCQLRLISREGAITVPAVRGDVEIRAQNGEIFLGPVSGSAIVKSGLGNVTVTSCTGPLRVEARSGNVLVGRLGSSAQIEAVGGAIEVQASHGPLEIRGDGSDVHVGFVYPLRGDADVRASGGDVEATFESALRANLDVRASSFGQVRIRDLELATTSGRAGESHVVGTLGGGGAHIEIRASGGNVRLRGVPVN